MKPTNLLTISLFLLMALCLPSCSDPVHSLTGDYSYKVSGTATIGAGTEVVLPMEQGALQIVHLSDRTYLLTMNVLGGIVYTGEAVLSDNTLTLQDCHRTLHFTREVVDSTLLTPITRIERYDYNVDVTGTGELHDETIVFSLRYEGTHIEDQTTLRGDDIVMVARKND